MRPQNILQCKINSNKFSVCLLVSFVIYILVFKYLSRAPFDYVPAHLRKYIIFDDEFTPNTEHNATYVDKLYKKLESLNAELQVTNYDKFGHVETDTTVITIQVHRDAERLQYLIISLAQVRRIRKALLVFSHSYYDTRINNLIKSISFCKTVQIFYPYSSQLHPNEHGPEADGYENLTGKSNNRDARRAEYKQHWWWKANFVFNGFAWSKIHKGTVIFLDEDDYVLPDMLHMLTYLQKSLSYIPEVEVMSFGRLFSNDLDFDKLTVDAWRPPFDKGLAFNRTTWRKIFELSSEYCLYDDSSWSYSLLHLFGRSRKGYVDMVACMAPRVLSTAMYRSGKYAVESIWWIIQNSHLFPESVQAVMLFSRMGRVVRNLRAPPKGNGGWSDNRELLLCLDPLMTTTVNEIDAGYSTTVPSVFT